MDHLHLGVEAALSYMHSFLTHPIQVLQRSLRAQAALPVRPGPTEPPRFSGRASCPLLVSRVGRVQEPLPRQVAVVEE